MSEKICDNISLITIVKNEERHIRKLFLSVKDLVKEIVVVDTGSNDSTLEICKEYSEEVLPNLKWKIIQNPCEWSEKIFSENKQLALNHATENWVLNLDADEILSAELDGEIRSFIHQKEKDCLAMNRINFRRDALDCYEQLVYLWRRCAGYRYIAHLPYHGMISLKDNEMDLGKVGQAKGYIYHFGWWDITEKEFQIKKEHYKVYEPFIPKGS